MVGRKGENGNVGLGAEGWVGRSWERGEGGAEEIVSTEVGDACMIEDPHGGQQSRARNGGEGKPKKSGGRVMVGLKDHSKECGFYSDSIGK